MSDQREAAAHPGRQTGAGWWPLIIQLLATGFMTGLIWFVQLVHYPMMEGWPHDDFGRWELAHRDRTGPVVIPPMLAEGAAAAWLLIRRPRGVPAWLPLLGIGLLASIWASTFFLQVPCHLKLSAGWDAATHRLLVQSNWIRTVLWSARLGVAVAMLVRYQPSGCAGDYLHLEAGSGSDRTGRTFD